MDHLFGRSLHGKHRSLGNPLLPKTPPDALAVRHSRAPDLRGQQPTGVALRPLGKNHIFVRRRYLFFLSPRTDFFDGILELGRHFEISLDSKQSTKRVAVLKLVPKKEDPSLQSLFLWIELGSYQIKAIESHDALGNVNRVTLESQRTVSNLDPKLFQLEIPPSTVVLDPNGRELSPSDIENLKKKLAS